MKILHYLFGLPPVRGGGLPRYALDLMKEQKKIGNDICMLVPGPMKGKQIQQVSIKQWKAYQGVSCYRVINPIYIPNASGINRPREFMPEISANVYREWLRQLRPDIIHVHSMLGIHAEFFEAAKELGITIVYTTHDYFGLCPKIDYLKESENCDNTDWGRCIECCRNATSLKKLRIEQSDIYRKYRESEWFINFVHGIVMKKIKQTRKCTSQSETPASECEEREADQRKKREYQSLQAYYIRMFELIDYYHFNSNQTRNVYEKTLGKLCGEVIPVMNRGICDRRKKKEFEDKLRIGYVGTLNTMKGYDYLIRELDQVYENGRTDFCLNTYLLENELERPYIRNHKPFSTEQQKQVYDEMDVLVVPSQWRETFGMVVLEALSYGVPVLVSEYVGAKMLLDAHTNIGIEFLCEKGSLQKVVEKIYDDRGILAKMNQCIIEAQLPLNYTEHVTEICSMYDRAKRVR